LEELPGGMDVWFLNAERCTALKAFPADIRIRNGGLNVRGCTALTELPKLASIATLDIGDCPLIGSLPKKLSVRQWVDVGGSGITRLSPSISACVIRWRGVPVGEKIAFRPDTITSKETLGEKNAERRRVMVERMGFEKFMTEAGGKVIDRDSDPGGKRELLRLPLEDDEDIVCLSCNCPSTQRHYLLRVPPTIKGCHQAAAWMAGFDNPDDYDPIIET
jgi:hypothetical protein